MKVMVDIEGHRGGTIMKLLYLVSLLSLLFAVPNLAALLILPGGVSVIKIPYLTFGKR
jgi:hypothetical protein